MDYKSETQKILSYYYSQFQEEAMGIAFAILDREHHRILTSQTDFNWSQKVGNINGKHDPFIRMIVASSGDKIITPNVCCYSFYSSPFAKQEILKRKNNGTQNPLILVRRISKDVSTIFTIYFKNNFSAQNEPCIAKISGLNKLISDKICMNLLLRNDEINKSSAAQEAPPNQFSQDVLLEKNLKQPAQNQKENQVLIVAF